MIRVNLPNLRKSKQEKMAAHKERSDAIVKRTLEENRTAFSNAHKR